MKSFYEYMTDEGVASWLGQKAGQFANAYNQAKQGGQPQQGQPQQGQPQQGQPQQGHDGPHPVELLKGGARGGPDMLGPLFQWLQGFYRAYPYSPARKILDTAYTQWAQSIGPAMDAHNKYLKQLQDPNSHEAGAHKNALKMLAGSPSHVYPQYSQGANPQQPQIGQQR